MQTIFPLPNIPVRFMSDLDHQQQLLSRPIAEAETLLKPVTSRKTSDRHLCQADLKFPSQYESKMTSASLRVDGLEFRMDALNLPDTNVNRFSSSLSEHDDAGLCSIPRRKPSIDHWENFSSAADEETSSSSSSLYSELESCSNGMDCIEMKSNPADESTSRRSDDSKMSGHITPPRRGCQSILRYNGPVIACKGNIRQLGYQSARGQALPGG